MRKQFLPIVPKSAANLVQNAYICVGDAVVAATRSVWNLGAYLDQHLDMSTHVSMTIKCCYHHRDMSTHESMTIKCCCHHLNHIKQISHYLPRSMKECVVNALVALCMDYCNSLLYETSKGNLNHFQVLKNDAARLIIGLPCQAHATPIRRELHWLPVCDRVNCKVLLLACKALHGTAPTYVTELVQTVVPASTLCSGSCHLLDIPHTRRPLGDLTSRQQLCCSGTGCLKQSNCVDFWTHFKTCLKTHLFQTAYNQFDFIWTGKLLCKTVHHLLYRLDLNYDYNFK